MGKSIRIQKFKGICEWLSTCDKYEAGTSAKPCTPCELVPAEINVVAPAASWLRFPVPAGIEVRMIWAPVGAAVVDKAGRIGTCVLPAGRMILWTDVAGLLTCKFKTFHLVFPRSTISHEYLEWSNQRFLMKLWNDSRVSWEIVDLGKVVCCVRV